MTAPDTTAAGAARSFSSGADPRVRDFRQVLLWPLQLRRVTRDFGFMPHWEVFTKHPGKWQRVADPLMIEDDSCAIGYAEFVYFLPYVQRFLYGMGEEGREPQASLHLFRRTDVARARVLLRRGGTPVELDVGRLHLYFFHDVDTALMALEVGAHDLALADAGEILDRFGRPYPPAWDAHDQGVHCTDSIELIGHDGALLSVSDYNDRDKFLSTVKKVHHTPLSAHWEFLLHPLVPAYKGGGLIKYYQIENKRIPLMSYLSFDEPRELTRGDMVRLGFAAKWGDPDTLPYSSSFLGNFESQHCYDRYWEPDHPERGMDTRYMFCGLSFAMITRAGNGALQRDLLHHFRHQFFQIGLIAHFHKAALLNLSNRFSRAVERLHIQDLESVNDFKRNVRQTLEIFLRFNNRYWFHEISNQVQASDFFQRFRQQLGTEALYDEVREEAHDINQYLDNDRMRKQTDNAMRLTVVSACGMVGTVATGFLGMNLYAHAELPTLQKVLIFFAAFIPTILLAVYTVSISRRLADFMEALSNERATWREKVSMFSQIWRANRPKREVQGGFGGPDV